MFFPSMSAKFLSAMQPFILLILIFSQILTFLNDRIGDFGHYVQHFNIKRICLKRICLRLMLGDVLF